MFRGMARPMVRPQAALGMAAIIHKNLLDLPPVSNGVTLRPEHAVDWLIDTYLASDGDIVLCPVGPLTNIAMAIQKEPRILEFIPEAAKVVVSCGRPIRMVSLDATHCALLSTQDAQHLRDLDTPAGIAAAAFVMQRIVGYQATQPILEHPDSAPIRYAPAVCDSRSCPDKPANIQFATVSEAVNSGGFES